MGIFKAILLYFEVNFGYFFSHFLLFGCFRFVYFDVFRVALRKTLMIFCKAYCKITLKELRNE